LRFEEERAAAEVERHCILDGERRQDNLDARKHVVAEHALVGGEIAVGARGEPARELVIGDESGSILLERCVAEHMVRMHVGVDYIANRLVGHGADGVAQLASNLDTAQRVDHRNRIAANNEACIGHVAAIFGRLHLIAALMHEHAGSDLAHLNRLWCRRCGVDRDAV